ncbi:MAG: response regulator receiver protein [Gemmataceae bacterium]|nr:response regulator receiver protein [Gemmataceae bacterium]
MSRRILIACTDVGWVTTSAAALTREGFEAETVSSGVDCLTRAREWHPHLIVMGANLPWGTAVGVLTVLHEDGDQPAVLTLLLAADPDLTREDLRPEWNCRVVPEALTADDLCHLARELGVRITDGCLVITAPQPDMPVGAGAVPARGRPTGRTKKN